MEINFGDTFHTFAFLMQVLVKKCFQINQASTDFDASNEF